MRVVGPFAGSALVAAAVAVLVGAAAPPVLAEPGHPAVSYLLVVTPGSVSDPGYPLRPAEASWAELRCHPPGGRHPRSTEACALLGRYGGSVAAVDESAGAFCTQTYSPVTVQSYSADEDFGPETFGNACLLDAAKGAVFELDSADGGSLRPAKAGPERPETPGFTR